MLDEFFGDRKTEATIAASHDDALAVKRLAVEDLKGWGRLERTEMDRVGAMFIVHE